LGVTAHRRRIPESLGFRRCCTSRGLLAPMAMSAAFTPGVEVTAAQGSRHESRKRWGESATRGVRFPCAILVSMFRDRESVFSLWPVLGPEGDVRAKYTYPLGAWLCSERCWPSCR
jgi:hypothetical protein